MPRAVANPLALGFSGLAGATLVASGLELGWIPADERDQAGLVLLLFAPALQGGASVAGFVRDDLVAATGMGILAGTWLCTGAAVLAGAPGEASRALGTLLLASAAGLAATAAAAVRSKPLVAAVVGTASIRLAATGIYELSSSAAWSDVAGVLGLVLLGLALLAVVVTLLGPGHRGCRRRAPG